MGMSWGDYNKISQNLLFLVNSGWQLDSYHLATILAQLPILLQILQVLRQPYIPGVWEALFAEYFDGAQLLYESQL